MWFWIVVMAFLFMVFLVTKSVAQRRKGAHAAGLREGHDVSLQGVWSNAGDGSGRAGDAGGDWGDGGWGGGDGGGE